MKASTLALTAALAVLAATDCARAAECTTQQVAAADALISDNKALFQACATQVGSGAAPTSFLAAAFASADKAAPLCASDGCVRALIVSMEKLPDCCSPAGASGAASVTNYPRLADDILHQCDLIDERLLAAELEAEVAKLPDLKVQIKSVRSGGASSGSGSAAGKAGNATVGDVDVVIDVKKREIMKDGGTNTTTVDPTAQSPATAARSSQVALALAVVALLSTFA
ncbi:hypothetical protein PybrP1_008883 [[Pythium] brassicae (nom. inval.)]|nr:hypothetical protein PybrP1_008883 [[Pythium] brassicae (nom. inval.)]